MLPHYYPTWKTLAASVSKDASAICTMPWLPSIAQGIGHDRLSVSSFPDIHPPYAKHHSQVWSGAPAASGFATHDPQAVKHWWLGGRSNLQIQMNIPDLFTQVLTRKCRMHLWCCTTPHAQFSSTHRSFEVMQWSGPLCRIIDFNFICFVARLQQAITRSGDAMTTVETQTLSILIFIVSLLGEHYDFDHLRVDQAGKYDTDSGFKKDLNLLIFWNDQTHSRAGAVLEQGETFVSGTQWQTEK